MSQRAGASCVSSTRRCRAALWPFVRLPSAVPLVGLFLSACGVLGLDDRCGPEFRTTRAEATIWGPDLAHPAVWGSVVLEVQEARPDSVAGRLVALSRGPAPGDPGPLRGHVLAARLVSAAGASVGATVASIGTAPPSADAFLGEPATVFPDAAALLGVRGALTGGGLLLELRTDMPEAPLLRVPVSAGVTSRWERAHCS